MEKQGLDKSEEYLQQQYGKVIFSFEHGDASASFQVRTQTFPLPTDTKAGRDGREGVEFYILNDKGLQEGVIAGELKTKPGESSEFYSEDVYRGTREGNHSAGRLIRPDRNAPGYVSRVMGRAMAEFMLRGLVDTWWSSFPPLISPEASETYEAYLKNYPGLTVEGPFRRSAKDNTNKGKFKVTKA